MKNVVREFIQNFRLQRSRVQLGVDRADMLIFSFALVSTILVAFCVFALWRAYFPEEDVRTGYLLIVIPLIGAIGLFLATVTVGNMRNAQRKIHEQRVEELLEDIRRLLSGQNGSP